MRWTGPARPLGLLGVAIALVCAGCTPAGLESAADDPGTGDATPEASPATSTSDAASPDAGSTTDDVRATVDLAAGWERLVPIATASGDDTATVRLRGLDGGEEAGIVWILWRRPSDGDEVFRVTQTGLDQLRHLTRGDVAGVSQQVLASGADELELLVVSSTPWELTAFRGGRAQLPDVAREDVVGSGPTWLAVGGPVDLDLELDQPEQLTLLQLYDIDGAIVSDAGLTPEQVSEPIPIAAGVTLMLLDVDGGWRLAATTPE